MGNNSNYTALTLSGAGVAVSMVYQIQHGNDPIPVMVIGGIWTGVVVGITAVNADVGTALAAVFLLGMFLTRGTAIIDLLTGFTTPDKPAKDSTKRKAHHG